MTIPSPMSRARRTWAVACTAFALAACATPTPAPDASASATPPPASSGARGADATAAPSSTAGGRDAPAASTTASASAPRDMSVFFEFDSSTLTGAARTLAQQHADYLAGHRQAVRLEGNADERGSREYNIALGQRRAEAVRQMLTLRGLPADTVEAVSYGEERPRCTDDVETCFAENRRVDFVYRR
jgi:peptidoglycan-associated lipoprotein